MHARIVTGFCPLLQARMSQLIATHKVYNLYAFIKKKVLEIKLKIISYTPKTSLFIECLNKNPVYAQTYWTVDKEDTPDALINP